MVSIFADLVDNEDVNLYVVTIRSVRGQNEQVGSDAACTVSGRLGAVTVMDWTHISS